VVVRIPQTTISGTLDVKKPLAITLAVTCALACTLALAQSPNQRLRGTVKSFDGNALVIAERSGETMTLALADNFAVSEVLPIEPSAIKPNGFIGTAAVPGPDGTLRALEVLVFPEAARGTGEGHSAWDLQPGSTMTNATVSELAATPEGRTLKLRYKDGEKTVVVPEDVPIVTVKPGERSLLVPGAKVVVFAQVRDGKPTAMRALAGKDGFTPPM
jgi:hypothetical protein